MPKLVEAAPARDGVAQLDAAVADRFAAIVGLPYALRDAADHAPYLVEPRDAYFGATPLVLRPGSSAEVAAILRLAGETGAAIVPQGGNTGLVGGQIPDRSGRQIVLSLTRLDRIREIEPAANTMTLEAGVTLWEAQAAARSVDRLFALLLASEGSCTIGGVLSTNAGGTGVLAYGNARDLVLGVEVALASGQIWNGLRKLRKDNTGYDLRNLFVGAEGTLGVITAAVLKLAPRPRGRSVAFVGLADPEAALKLLAVAQGVAGASLTAFELLPRIAIDVLVRHVPGCADPLAGPHAWYVLFEIVSLRTESEADATMEAVLEAALAGGMVEDGVRAASLDQAARLWRLRHEVSDVQKREGGSIKHDIAVPLAAVPELIARAAAAMTALVPGSLPFPFGHVGDGNIHLNLTQPPGADRAAFLARTAEINEAVYAIVADLGGTISAEHGIGVLKREALRKVKDPIELALMRQIKTLLDPRNILNPGKVL